MAQTEIIKQLKFRISNLQSNLSQKQKTLDEYKFIQSQADSKIKGMQKIQNQKVKSLLNSIQVLKKQKASIQGLSKQHKRSKLIQQLNKEINDQDLVIQILRKYLYEKEGKEKGRNVCDQIIVKALNKGPERIRPLTREELRMQIEKLKQINFNLQKKMKTTDKVRGGQTRADLDASESQISSISQNQSNLEQNKTEQFLNKIRSLQIQSENLKLQSNSKNKIIEKLKASVLEGQKYKSQVELLKNQIDISNRKLFAFQRTLKQSKQNMNKKIIDLYQRQLKVEQLQMVGQQNSDKLKSLNQKHGIFLQEIMAEKQAIQAEFAALKQQNEKLILQNITHKKHQENQKSKIDQIKQINQRQKQDLSRQLKAYQDQVQRILEQNQKIKRKSTDMETKIFEERANWIEQKQKFLQQIENGNLSKAESQKVTLLMREIDELKQQNRKLQAIFLSGQGETQAPGSSKMLLQRLDNYKRKVQYYENKLGKGDKSKQIEIYNQLFEKYNRLSEQFENYKSQQHSPLKKRNQQRKQIIDMTRKQKDAYEAFSSGIDSLNLADVDSEILDNFNSSYDYSIHLDQNGLQTKVPKISQADKELLKLINSDLWYFVKDDQLTKKIEEVSMSFQKQNDIKDKIYTSEQMRKLKNLSHPKGKKIKIYEQEINRLNQMNDDISITSAVQKQINAYDSDINIQFGKINNQAPNYLNYENLKEMNSDIGSDVQVSSVQSGDSNIRKKKKIIVQKASKIKFGSQLSVNSSQIDSQLSQYLLNSDVSSVNLSQRQLNRIDSDVETDFRKKKAK